MQLLTILLLALPTLSLASPQSGVIGLEPLDPKLLTDLNQYVPAKRNKFNWEIKQRAKATECECSAPQCPTYLQEASLNQCRFNHALACYQRSNGGCPKP